MLVFSMVLYGSSLTNMLVEASSWRSAMAGSCTMFSKEVHGSGCLCSLAIFRVSWAKTDGVSPDVDELSVSIQFALELLEHLPTSLEGPILFLKENCLLSFPTLQGSLEEW